MKKILIVYHSQSTSTRRLAEAVYRGSCEEEGVSVSLLAAMEADSEDLLACDGVIFGSPENFGYLSGGLKDFFDRTFYALEPRHINIPYAVFISAGNDGRGAVRQLQRIVKGYPLRPALEPVIVRGESVEQHLLSCEALGQAFATGLEMGIF